MGQRVSSGIVSLVAVSAGNGGAIANDLVAIAMPTQVAPQGSTRLVIRKIAWYHVIGVNATLLVGYSDLANLFQQVLPTILMVNGINDEWVDPPIVGNTREGFMADTTLVTGSTGSIWVGCPTVGIGAAPANVQVVIEAEYF